MVAGMTGPQPVGIIGLGLLGEALARRLRAASFPVIGFDVDAARLKALVALGGAGAASIAEVGRAARTIVLAVFDTAQVEHVVERDLLGAPGDGADTLVLCTSTCDPDRIAALAARVRPRGIRFLETPVVGSSAQVAAGDSLALVGGEAALVAAAEGILQVLFPVRAHVGNVGDGGRAKLALNLVLGLNRLALAEGLLFAEGLGLDPQLFLDVARRSTAYSRVMDNKGPKMVRGDFTPEAHARQHLKDVDLILAKALWFADALPALAVHADVLRACVAAGEGDLDNSVIVAELRRRGQATDKEGRHERR